MDQKQVIIQCAASKAPKAGHFKTLTGQRVKFVARPAEVPCRGEYVYLRPDDDSDVPGQTWRQRLVIYNSGRDNPFGLLKAYCLYEHRIYKELVAALGPGNVFILSAGWGLVRADYPLPDYDITFSNSAKGEKSYKRRRRQDKYDDFCHLRDDPTGPIISFCSKDYLPLLFRLTDTLSLDKRVYYYGLHAPAQKGWQPVRFDLGQTSNPHTWPYDCASEFVKKYCPRDESSERF